MSKQADLLKKLQSGTLTKNQKTTAPKPEVKEREVIVQKKTIKKQTPKTFIKPQNKNIYLVGSEIKHLELIERELFLKGVKATQSVIIRSALNAINLNDAQAFKTFMEQVKKTQETDGRKKSE